MKNYLVKFEHIQMTKNLYKCNPNPNGKANKGDIAEVSFAEYFKINDHKRAGAKENKGQADLIINGVKLQIKSKRASLTLNNNIIDYKACIQANDCDYFVYMLLDKTNEYTAYILNKQQMERLLIDTASITQSSSKKPILKLEKCSNKMYEWLEA